MKLPCPGFEAKIVGSVGLSHRVAQLVRPIVFTNGVFDILHRGHVTYLAQARALGASLVVAVNSDSSVRQLGKGKDRPINSEADRAAVVAALEGVTLVTVFEDRLPLAPLRVVRPDIYVKGGDYDMEAIPETELVRGWGGRAHAIPFEHDHSTTRFIDRIRLSTGPASTMSDEAGTS
jgi:D-glycero-beta-D-manno-heptose 1-phosphate adenylyltransferase